MIIIGEKVNGAIPSVAKATAQKDAEFIQHLAKVQADAGAHFIDVCAATDVAMELDSMKWLIDIVQAETTTPLAVDSPSAQICAECIQFCNSPGLVNSVSLEGDKVNVIFPLIADTDWECVVLLCDDSGIPKSAEKRMEILAAIMDKATKWNIDFTANPN